jgi:DNA polymerase (family 10)
MTWQGEARNGMSREAIVEALEELAALSELTGENPFKAKAYANAARSLHKTTVPESSWMEAGILESIPGVGKGTADRVRELLASGAMADLEALRSRVPEGVREVLDVPGLGPKKVASLWKELGIESPGELEYACIENRLVGLPGFGAKTQEKVLAGVRFRARHAGKILLPSALFAQSSLEGRLQGTLEAGTWSWSGEVSRFCPVVTGLELLATDRDAAARCADSLGLEFGPEGAVGRSPEGYALRLTPVGTENFGAAVVWHGSSEAFRRALAHRLAEAGLRWDEEGLYRGGKVVPTRDEKAFWIASGIQAIPPECREFPEALEADLSDLLDPSDIRGSFHVHTDWSDGGATLEEMVSAAEALGWKYIGICDHSVTAVYAGGLDAERLAAQGRTIAEVQSRHPAIRIFAGVESDILAEGELDYSEAVLEQLDLVVASVHSRFHLDEASQTRRLTTALSHPATTFLGHPTGRLLLSREPYAHRWDDVVAAAAKHGKCMELNANPHRQDVDWTELPGLRSAGVPIAINPDAHSVAGLEDLLYGVRAARKGLARRQDVLNTLSASEMEAYLASRKGGED